MKRIVAILLCALLAAFSAGCKRLTQDDVTAADPAAGFTQPFETGRLLYSAFSLRHDVKGLSLSGDKAGDAINKKEPAEEGIRPVFEFGERIDYRLVCGESDKGECTVYLRPHIDFSQYRGLDLSEGALYSAAHSFEEGVSGGFSADPEGRLPGYYDLLFTSNGQIFVYVVIRLYPAGELSGKTDAELDAMREQVAVNK